MNIKHLEEKIKSAYETGVTMDEAERLASEFLHAQIEVAEKLRVVDLDARMRKSGVKAVKAAVYMEAVGKEAKKPSDTLLEQVVNLSDLVSGEQQRYDEAESERDYLSNIYNILREGHIHFRGIAKGRFE